MQKNIQMSIENCYVAFYENGQLHPCNLSFYDQNLLKIQKNSHNLADSFSKKQLNISEDGMSFNLKINLTLRFTISMRKINITAFYIEKIEVLIRNKDTNEQLRLYVPKNSDNYLKLYNFFKSNSFIQKFDQYFSTSHMLKYPSEKQKAQFFLVQQKLTQKNKMVKRFQKSEFGIDTLNKIMKEIQIQNKLNCTGIMRFQGFFQDDQFLYLVYNQVPTKNLKQFLKIISGFDKSCVKVIIKQLLEAVLEMQINGITHNNIKPSTIELIKDNQNWKCCINHFSNATLLSEWSLQNQGSIVKQYGSSSPEILNPKVGRLASKSDVFSIGVLFYQLIFDKDPFRIFDKDPFRILTSSKKIVIDTYPIIDFDCDEMDRMSFEAKQLLKRMLEFDPEKRITIIEALTHRYFTSPQSSMRKSLMKQSKRQKNATPSKFSDSFLQNQTPKLSSAMKQNSSPIFKTTGPSKEQTKNKLKCSLFRRRKPTTYKKNNAEGEIDSQDIDDSHICLEPRNSNIMTPSYEQKKTNEFKFFTV